MPSVPHNVKKDEAPQLHTLYWADTITIPLHYIIQGCKKASGRLTRSVDRIENLTKQRQILKKQTKEKTLHLRKSYRLWLVSPSATCASYEHHSWDGRHQTWSMPRLSRPQLQPSAESALGRKEKNIQAAMICFVYPIALYQYPYTMKSQRCNRPLEEISVGTFVIGQKARRLLPERNAEWRGNLYQRTK